MQSLSGASSAADPSEAAQLTTEEAGPGAGAEVEVEVEVETTPTPSTEMKARGMRRSATAYVKLPPVVPPPTHPPTTLPPTFHATTHLPRHRPPPTQTPTTHPLSYHVEATETVVVRQALTPEDCDTLTSMGGRVSEGRGFAHMVLYLHQNQVSGLVLF